VSAAAALIRDARTRAGLTQAELANRLGKAQATVAKLEQAGANPRLSTLDEVMNALGQRLELRTSQRPSSVDETLIARNLRLTPAERLRAFEVAHNEVEALRRAMRGEADDG
jgi:transcriptional regulator with XRE-family HTH domain